MHDEKTTFRFDRAREQGVEPEGIDLFAIVTVTFNPDMKVLETQLDQLPARSLKDLADNGSTPLLSRIRRLASAGKGDHYDCEPLQMGEIERLFEQFGFRHANRCPDAVRETIAVERPHSVATRMVRALPDSLLRPFLAIIQTLIYTLQHARA